MAGLCSGIPNSAAGGTFRFYGSRFCSDVRCGRRTETEIVSTAIYRTFPDCGACPLVESRHLGRGFGDHPLFHHTSWDVHHPKPKGPSRAYLGLPESNPGFELDRCDRACRDRDRFAVFGADWVSLPSLRCPWRLSLVVPSLWRSSTLMFRMY